MPDASGYWDGEMMARQPQAWPVECQVDSNIIIEENELFILGLLLSFNELYRRDNSGLLRDLLPALRERITRTYQAAKRIELEIDERIKPPLWARLTRDIINFYPHILAQLKQIEPSLRANRFIEIKPALVEIFNTSAAIHIRLLKIPGGKTRYVLQLENFNLFTRVIK